MPANTTKKHTLIFDSTRKDSILWKLKVKLNVFLLTGGLPMHRRIWSGPRYDGLYRPEKQPLELIFILSGDGYMDIDMHPPLKSSSSFNALAASNGVGE